MQTIKATISLLSAPEGGKNLPIGNGWHYSCPVFFHDIKELSGHGWDCRLLLGEHSTTIHPGETMEGVRVAFLSPELVLPRLRVGSEFMLWEFKEIGKGVVTGFD